MSESEPVNPEHPFPLMDAAIALHELFLTLQVAGFTEAQALFIVAQTFRPKDGA